MEYVIYHKSQAGNPELHTDGNWYYQPDGYDSGDVFSRGYATREAAEEACWLWATTEDEDEPTIRYDPDINADEIRRAIRNGGGWLVAIGVGGLVGFILPPFLVARPSVASRSPAPHPTSYRYSRPPSSLRIRRRR